MGKEGSSSARAGYVASLLKKWVSFHRPDVLEAANTESFKKFPHLKKSNKVIILPESLRNLK